MAFSPDREQYQDAVLLPTRQNYPSGNPGIQLNVKFNIKYSIYHNQKVKYNILFPPKVKSYSIVIYLMENQIPTT